MTFGPSPLPKQISACSNCWKLQKPSHKSHTSCIDVTSNWPVVYLEAAGKYSEEAERCHLNQLIDLIERGHRFALVVDSQVERSENAKGLILAWMKDNDALLNRHCVGIGVVVRRTATRFILGTVLLAARPSVTVKVFDEKEPAIRWAREQIKL